MPNQDINQLLGKIGQNGYVRLEFWWLFNFICIVASAIIIWFLYHREYGAEEPCVRLVVNKP